MKKNIEIGCVQNSFYRAFGLPANADPQKIEAKMRNGQLDIRVGKAKRLTNRNRVIEVS